MVYVDRIFLSVYVRDSSFHTNCELASPSVGGVLLLAHHVRALSVEPISNRKQDYVVGVYTPYVTV